MSALSHCLQCIRLGRCSGMEPSCLELALEGERLCKAGDQRGAVAMFQYAIQVGTEDLQILSAIYSQLGNAYFHLHEYGRALEYHGHDLTLTRTIGDELGEAKASGNLGNTLKLLGRFDEAVVCCQRHLEITRAMYDKVGQARALYNFGNVYHALGKSICCTGVDPADYPEEARIALKKASQYYEANLSLVKEFCDQAAQGRTYGNLGNVYYLLGDFEKAVAAHETRLLIAREFGDKSAQRRAHCNLGNAHIFLGHFDVAVGHYKRTLQLARLLKDRSVEAQACYSLGNTYTLLQDYERAIDYHLKHLVIAQELDDRVGEGRACWSLGNAHTALGNHEMAIHFAEKHLEIAQETGDRSSEATARMNLSDLRLVVGLKANASVHFNSYADVAAHDATAASVTHQGYQGCDALPGVTSQPGRRSSDDRLKLLKPEAEQKATGQLIPHWDEDVFAQSPRTDTIKASTKLFLFQRLKSKKQKNKSPSKGQEGNSSLPDLDQSQSRKAGSRDNLGEDGFFDLLSRFQGNRMDDQRCSLMDGQSRLGACPPSSTPPPVVERKRIVSCEAPSQDPGHFLELLASSQACRLDDQRASPNHFPGLRLSISDPPHTPPTSSTEPAQSPAPASGTEPPRRHFPCSAPVADAERPETGDDGFFDLLAKCQASRLNDQRCAAPPPAARGATVPDEDFLSLILRSQANRMEEQRVPLPPAASSHHKPD